MCSGLITLFFTYYFIKILATVWIPSRMLWSTINFIIMNFDNDLRIPNMWEKNFLSTSLASHCPIHTIAFACTAAAGTFFFFRCLKKVYRHHASLLRCISQILRNLQSNWHNSTFSWYLFRTEMNCSHSRLP